MSAAGARKTPDPSGRAHGPDDPGFGVYVHWPFCESKCPYCDFNSHVTDSVDHARWRRAYLVEIERLAAEFPGRRVESIYFGGGTPSLMDPAVVGAIIDAVQTHWTLSNAVEITLEANPGSVEIRRFQDFRTAGVERVSLGVQALDDASLKRLGRLHSAAEARRALETARTHFERVSFDLIYTRQLQTLAEWRAELECALALAGDHLSLYQLTIEPGTPFAARRQAGGLRGIPDDDHAADFYLTTQEMCAKAGLPAYEVSNHARPGCVSRHNMIYWRSGDYAGIGPGAHGRLTNADRRVATDSYAAPAAWLDAIERTGNGEQRREGLDQANQIAEFLMMGLRLSEGVDLGRYPGLLQELRGHGGVDEMISSGFLELDGDNLSATLSGRLILNTVLGRLLDGQGEENSLIS